MRVRPYAAVIFGAICAAMSLELFYIPHRFVDGGMVGLAVVIGRAVDMQPVYALLPLNFACIWAALQTLGQPFLYRSATAFITMGLVLRIVGPFDPFLSHTVAAVVGGAGVGAGVSLVVQAGGAIDGCEVLGLLVQRMRGIPVPWFSFLFNAIVFGIIIATYGLAHAYHSLLAQGVALIVMAVLLRETPAARGSW